MDENVNDAVERAVKYVWKGGSGQAIHTFQAIEEYALKQRRKNPDGDVQAWQDLEKLSRQTIEYLEQDHPDLEDRELAEKVKDKAEKHPEVQVRDMEKLDPYRSFTDYPEVQELLEKAKKVTMEANEELEDLKSEIEDGTESEPR